MSMGEAMMRVPLFGPSLLSCYVIHLHGVERRNIWRDASFNLPTVQHFTVGKNTAVSLLSTDCC